MSAVYYSYTVMSNLCEGLGLGKGWIVGSFYRQFPTSSICNKNLPTLLDFDSCDVCKWTGDEDGLTYEQTKDNL